MKKIAVIIPFVLLLSACATKQYPQAAAVSGEESALMNCHDIKTEIAKTRSIQQEIEKTGQFDGKTVLLSLIHISEPTRQAEISYAVFCLKKKKRK